MCGILGIVAGSPVNQLLYDGLLLLQHRGQDAAGIVTSEHNSFHMLQGRRHGARRVPHPQHALAARHHRASRTCATRPPGSAFKVGEAQPFYVNSPFGIVLGTTATSRIRAAEGGDVPHRTCGTSTPARTPRCW
jgi:amidophosphoribosyltransferase